MSVVLPLLLVRIVSSHTVLSKKRSFEAGLPRTNF